MNPRRPDEGPAAHAFRLRAQGGVGLLEGSWVAIASMLTSFSSKL